jgi:hypothetical protein
MLLICRDATENSVIANVALALDARRRNEAAAILFTEEALAALAGESFGWSPLFRTRDARIRISRGATALGMPVAAERDDRWTDIGRLLASAQGAGVELLACPIWSRILGVDGGLPPSVRQLADVDALAHLIESRRVIGGF